MLSIREAVEDLVISDNSVREGMRRGVINLSQYAREIRNQVAENTKKDVGLQSIVVTLSRIEKTLSKQQGNAGVEIQQLAVQSPIVQLIYPKNHDTLTSLISAIKSTNELDDIFFSISTSTKDIGIVLSEKVLPRVKSSFAVQPLVEKHGLSAVSVRFSEKLVREANVGLSLLEKIASRNVVLDAALTTYNEFTLIFDSKYLQDAVAALSPKK